MTVTDLRLPGVGRVLQWRADGFWRELNDAQHRDEREGLFVPAGDEWVRWTGLHQPQAGGGGWDGTAAWWCVYGELPHGVRPEVVLAGRNRPEVLTVGRIWACEWFSPAQPATVRVGAGEFELPFAEPRYRRP